MKFTNSIVFIIILASLVILFFLTLYKPVTREILVLQKDILENQKRNRQERLISQVLEDTDHTVDALTLEVEELKKGLLPKGQQSLFMNDLREFVIEFGFRRDNISPRNPKKCDPYEFVVLDLEVVGGFQEIYCFIQKLEELLPLIGDPGDAKLSICGQASRLVSSSSATAPPAVGIGSPWGSNAGRPSISSMRAISRSDTACSRISASWCTSLQSIFITSTRKSSTRR